MKRKKPRYLLICNTSDGLVAQINGIVVQLQLAQRLGLEPIVYLHRRSYMFGGPNPYFDEGYGPNVWDYFFAPIGPPASDLSALAREGEVVTLSTASELARLYRWEPASWFMNPYGYYRSVENYADGPYPAAWWDEQRNKARALFSSGLIRVQPAILDQVERFVAAKFSAPTLGLQLRGSDKFDFGVGANLSRKVTPEEYYPHIERYLAENPTCDRIFVATDQRQWLKSLEQTYPGKIISYSEKSLSDSNQNRFHDASEKAARGIEVLVDALVLSRCSYALKCHAAVGELAVTLNPQMGFLDLNYAVQPFEARSQAQRALAVPAIRAVGGVWRALSDGGMGLVDVVSVAGDEIVVDRSAPRSLNTKTEASAKAPRPPLFSRRFVSDGLDWALRNLGAQCFAYTPRAGPVASP